VNDVSFNQTNDKVSTALNKFMCIQFAYRFSVLWFSFQILCKLEARLVVLDIRSGGVLKDISLPKHVSFEHLSIGSILCVSKQTVQLLNMHADEVSHTWHPRENANFTRACLARGEEIYVLSDVGDMAIIDLELEKAVQANGSAKPDPRELGPCIIAAMDTGFVQVWSLETKKAIKGFEAHAKCITFLEPFSDYKLLSVSCNRGIRVHNWRNGRLSNRAPIAADLGDPKRYHVKVDPGEHFVAVAGEYQVCVWILEKLVPLKILWCHSARITDLQITDLDENVWRLISSGEDGLCRVWDIESQSG
jgi:WD40 repeat protein